MSGLSNIEWTDATWNPVTGCTRVSAGCDHCYAVRTSRRMEGMGQKEKYGGLTVLNGNGERHFNGVVRCHEDVLDWPLRKKKPLRIFVNSMSDLFHKKVPFDFIDKVFAVMALCPQHTFQVLTKRADRMAEYFKDRDFADILISARHAFLRGPSDSVLHKCGTAYSHEDIIADSDTEWIREIFAEQGGRKLPQAFPLPNVWLGTSIENQKTADERIPHLLRVPAAVLFLSVEPLLGQVDLTTHISGPNGGGKQFPLVQWVICGGESGPGARPMHPDWVRSVRDQCAAADVPFFFKQWGEWAPVTPLYDGRDDAAENGRGDLHAVDRTGYIWNNGRLDGQPNDLRTWLMERVGKKRAGATLDGREHREWPTKKGDRQ